MKCKKKYYCIIIITITMVITITSKRSGKKDFFPVLENQIKLNS